MFKRMTIVTALTLLTSCTASGALENTAEETTQMSHEQASDKQDKDTPLADSTLTLNTVMTSEGVECPAVRGADGTLYTIPSMPQTFEAGAKLNIMIANPIIPFASFCQQGQTLDWLRIDWISAKGDILQSWEK